MEKVMNSAMANDLLDEKIAQRNEIAEKVETRKAEFETADVETRDAILEEVETLTKDAENLDSEIKELEETRNTYKEQEARMSLNATLSKVEERKEQIMEQNVIETKEYEKMYADMIRGKVDEKEVRSFLTRSGSANLSTATSYVPIPTIMQGFVETAWAEYGKFSRLVSETFEPAILRIPVEASADGAVWHSENDDAPAQEQITLSQVMLSPAMIKKHISMTDELMAMAETEFLRYVADELVYRVILALDEAIMTRTDANGLGVIGVAGNTLTESVSANLDFNVINEAIAKLLVFEDLTIAMNPQTFLKNFMSLTDQVGNPIYRVIHDNEGKVGYFLNGHRVEFTNALKPYDNCGAGETYAIVGNFRRGYRLNYPQGRDVITLVDPYTLATEDVVRMIAKLYVAGNVVKPKYFAELKVPASL